MVLFKIKFIICLIVSAFTGFFVALDSGEGSEPVTVGVLHSEKYTCATMMRNSHEMALEVINNEGGI
jgi:hypothetical protein